MKKLISTILSIALVLSLSTTAFAADDITVGPNNPSTGNYSPNPSTANTEVSFKVDPGYTITIPGSVTLDRKEDSGSITYENDLTIKADAMRIDQSKKVSVKINNDNKFKMETTDSSEISYEITVGENKIKKGDEVATFTTSTETKNSTLHLKADNPTYAGEYKGTLTFDISYADTREQEPA